MKTLRLIRMKNWLAWLAIAASATVEHTRVVADDSPIILPAWARGIESQLPDITPQLVSEVEHLREVIFSGQGTTTSGFSPEGLDAAKKLVALKGIADQALVWLYVRESAVPMDIPPGMENDPIVVEGIKHTNGTQRRNLLDSMRYDPYVAKWLLPAVRARLHWMEVEVAAKRTVQSISHAELSGTYSYLYNQGTWDDAEKIEKILVEASKAGIRIVDSENRAPLNLRQSTFRNNHDWVRRFGRPMWKYLAEDLVEANLIDKSVLSDPDPPPRAQDLPEIPAHSGGPSTKYKDSNVNQPSSEGEAMSWAVTILVIASAAILLCFLRNCIPK
jgi:hypothetical protein